MCLKAAAYMWQTCCRGDEEKPEKSQQLLFGEIEEFNFKILWGTVVEQIEISYSNSSFSVFNGSCMS